MTGSSTATDRERKDAIRIRVIEQSSSDRNARIEKSRGLASETSKR